MRLRTPFETNGVRSLIVDQPRAGMVNERFVLPVVLRPALKNRSTNDAALWILGLLGSLSGRLALLIDSPCDLFVAEISFDVSVRTVNFDCSNDRRW